MTGLAKPCRRENTELPPKQSIDGIGKLQQTRYSAALSPLAE